MFTVQGPRLTACLCALACTGAFAADRPEIDASSVRRLTLTASFRSDSVGAELSPPAYADGTLYLLTPFPHTLFAIDPDDGRVKWRHRPESDRSAAGLACCDRSRHGPVAIAGNVFFSTLDGRVVSLDASGAVRWNESVGNVAAGETIAGPPVVSAGRVVVGVGGDDNGSRGFLAALDAATGKPLWKHYGTGPDADVGIGDAFKPFYAVTQGSVATDAGKTTWPSGTWIQGGGGVAGPALADPAGDLLFHETGHPAPWNPDQRPGDNRYTGGLFARDAGSGGARWFVAFNSHDPFDYREGADLALDERWQGQPRRLLVHADANGFLYVLDRTTGEILAADPFVQSVVAQVDLHDGSTRYHPSQITKVDRQTRNVCPAWTGAVGAGIAQAPASSLVILPVSRLCMDIEPRLANFIQGTPYAGANVRLRVPQAAGGIVAWDLQARRPAWQVDERFPVLGAALVLADLVVYGTLEGDLKALDGRTGRLLWSYRLPAGVASQPIAFHGRDGRPHIAVVASAARLAGMSRQEALDGRDQSAGFGLAGLAALLPQGQDPAGTLFVFGLP